MDTQSIRTLGCANLAVGTTNCKHDNTLVNVKSALYDTIRHEDVDLTHEAPVG